MRLLGHSELGEEYGFVSLNNGQALIALVLELILTYSSQTFLVHVLWLYFRVCPTSSDMPL